MTPSLQDLLLPGGLRSNLFPANSRYNGIDTSTLESGGRTIIYLKRRFLPQADEFAVIQEYQVTAGDRIDNITAQFLSDPIQYWRVCDANNVMHPREAEEIGRRLRITLPRGVAGSAIA
jgi:hypothetical protein